MKAPLFLSLLLLLASCSVGVTVSNAPESPQACIPPRAGCTK
jgi:hypothetical protein